MRLFLLRRMPCGEFSGASRDTPLYDRPDRKDPADFELSTAMPNRSVGIPWWKPIGCTGCCILKSAMRTGVSDTMRIPIMLSGMRSGGSVSPRAGRYSCLGLEKCALGISAAGEWLRSAIPKPSLEAFSRRPLPPVAVWAYRRRISFVALC